MQVPTAQQIVNALIRRAEVSANVATPPQKLVNVLTGVTAHNDNPANADVKVEIGAVVRVIRLYGGGAFHHWGAAHVDKVCVSELGRLSFADPGP